MVVVSIVSVMSTVALPTYLNARDAASAGAVVGEAMGIPKECAGAAAASDLDASFTTAMATITINDKGAITCTFS